MESVAVYKTDMTYRAYNSSLDPRRDSAKIPARQSKIGS
jgi:hypothetical protein